MPTWVFCSIPQITHWVFWVFCLVGKICLQCKISLDSYHIVSISEMIFCIVGNIIVSLESESPLQIAILAVLLLVCYRSLVKSGLFLFISACYKYCCTFSLKKYRTKIQRIKGKKELTKRYKIEIDTKIYTS